MKKKNVKDGQYVVVQGVAAGMVGGLQQQGSQEPQLPRMSSCKKGHKKSKISGRQNSTPKNFPDEARKLFS